MFSKAKTIVGVIRNHWRRARIQGGKVGFETPEDAEYLPRRFLSPLRATRLLRRGCAVILESDSRGQEQLYPLLVEQRELVTNISILHDLSKKVSICTDDPSTVDAAIVLRSWLMLQLVALGERLDEVSQEVIETCRELDASRI